MRITVDVLSWLLTAAGFSTQQIPVMLCIAQYESAYKTDAINVNKDKSIDRGLFQINSKYWDDRCPGDMFNPGANVRCAKQVHEVLGYKGWVVFQKGLCSQHGNYTD